MALIIRSDTILSAPAPGPVLPPSFGVPDLLSFFAAASIPGAAGDVAASIPNSIPGAPDMRLEQGSQFVRATAGRKRLEVGPDFSFMRAPALDTLPGSATLAAVLRWTVNPNDVLAVVGLGSGSVMLDTAGKLTAYSGGTGNHPKTAVAPGANQWHRVIAVFDGTSSSITVNGVTVTGGAGDLGSGKDFKITGGKGTTFSVTAHAVIGHAATAAEIGTIDAALAQLIPA